MQRKEVVPPAAIQQLEGKTATRFMFRSTGGGSTLALCFDRYRSTLLSCVTTTGVLEYGWREEKGRYECPEFKLGGQTGSVDIMGGLEVCGDCVQMMIWESV